MFLIVFCEFAGRNEDPGPEIPVGPGHERRIQSWPQQVRQASCRCHGTGRGHPKAEEPGAACYVSKGKIPQKLGSQKLRKSVENNVFLIVLSNILRFCLKH